MGPEVPLNRRNTKQEALFQSKNSRKTKIKEQYFLDRTYYVNLFKKNQCSHVVYTQGDTAQKGQTAHHDHVNSTLLPRKPQ